MKKGRGYLPPSPSSYSPVYILIFYIYVIKEVLCIAPWCNWIINNKNNNNDNENDDNDNGNDSHNNNDINDNNDNDNDNNNDNNDNNNDNNKNYYHNNNDNKNWSSRKKKDCIFSERIF